VRPTADRRSAAGVVGLALLATAGTLTMVSAGAGVLASSPARVDAGLGIPSTAWQHGPLYVPGPAGRLGGTGQTGRPARPVSPITAWGIGAPLGSADPDVTLGVLIPPAVPVPVPVPSVAPTVTPTAGPVAAPALHWPTTQPTASGAWTQGAAKKAHPKGASTAHKPVAKPAKAKPKPKSAKEKAAKSHGRGPREHHTCHGRVRAT
jgi:hypothetical protein